MGFNSVLLILNDRLDEIARDPEFGQKVRSAILGHRRGQDNTFWPGQCQVIGVEHADTAQVIRVAANHGKPLGYGHWMQSDDDLIKQLNTERMDRARDAKRTAAQAIEARSAETEGLGPKGESAVANGDAPKEIGNG